MFEYRLSTVSIVSKYGLDWSATVWIGSEYDFIILLVESASESHTQNSTRTAPQIFKKTLFLCAPTCGVILAKNSCEKII